MTPVQPITLSGYYDHTDGTVGYYLWCAGPSRTHRPALLFTVPGWSEATRERLAAYWERDCAS